MKKPKVRFTVYGDPVPQGSKKAFLNKHTNRVMMVDQADKRLKPWRKAIVDEAREFDVQFDGAVSVDLVFVVHKPKRPRNERPIVRPDVDKLARGVLDALQASGLFEDDAQVVRLVAEKWYDDNVPRVEIEVREV